MHAPQTNAQIERRMRETRSVKAAYGRPTQGITHEQEGMPRITIRQKLAMSEKILSTKYRPAIQANTS